MNNQIQNQKTEVPTGIKLNDKDYLNHPKNMKRLTKELDRINKEYKCLRQYHDPLSESFKRLSYSQKASFTKKHAHPSIQRILEKK